MIFSRKRLYPNPGLVLNFVSYPEFKLINLATHGEVIRANLSIMVISKLSPPWQQKFTAPTLAKSKLNSLPISPYLFKAELSYGKVDEAIVTSSLKKKNSIKKTYNIYITIIIIVGASRVRFSRVRISV